MKRKIRRFSVVIATAALFVLTVFAVFYPSSLRADPNPCNCVSCHGNDPHGPNWQACSGCHQSPPATGSHLVHYNSEPLMNLNYGDVEIYSAADKYKFGCGNCHPLDKSKHRNGTADVELYNASAPEGSIKAKNPSTAAYDPESKTCANVYCHSGKIVISSSAVGLPLTYPQNPVPPGYTLNGSLIMDDTCSNLTYDPYTVISDREYATTPAWGATGTFLACTECHAFPLTTSYPEVQAGVGDSHQWIDDDGYPDLHAWNMGFDPIPCRTCHYATVTQTAPTRYITQSDGTERVVYDPVPLANRVAHVNGLPDVVFDTVNGVRYVSYWSHSDHTYSLSGAAYNAITKSCSGVACHYNESTDRWQKNPKWGNPYRWWVSSECDLCHRYSSGPMCQPGQ